jgi:hypothetical protein
MPKKGHSRKDRKSQAIKRMARAGIIPESAPIMIRSAETIHARANRLDGPTMFAVVDRFAYDNKPGQMSPEYSSMAHEAACALREKADIPQFGKRQSSQWDRARDLWWIA